jgi:hypothetical protein
MPTAPLRWAIDALIHYVILRAIVTGRDFTPDEIERTVDLAQKIVEKKNATPKMAFSKTVEKAWDFILSSESRRLSFLHGVFFPARVVGHRTVDGGFQLRVCSLAAFGTLLADGEASHLIDIPGIVDDPSMLAWGTKLQGIAVGAGGKVHVTVRKPFASLQDVAEFGDALMPLAQVRNATWFVNRSNEVANEQRP